MTARARLAPAPAAPSPARDPDPHGHTEVILIGSAGTWVRGRTLDAAYAASHGIGPLGARVVIVVSPVVVGAYVDETGALRWSGEHGRAIRPHYVSPVRAAGPSATGLAWPARRSDAMRGAVDALAADVAAAVADYVALPAE